MRADPGIGSKDAPIGTADWAKRFRLGWLSAFHDLPVAPKNFYEFYKRGMETRVWTILTGPDGVVFSSFDALCRAPEPWGFGKPWDDIKPHLLGIVSERELDLATVAPAVKPDPPAKGKPNRGKHNPDVNPGLMSGVGNSSAVVEARLRAIAERAPEPARDLYKRGLLGQKEAAKLGPKNAKPEDAERVTRVARDLAEEAKALDVSTEALRKKAQRALNVRARELLGIRKDRIAEALRHIEKLTDDERSRLFDACRERGWLA